MLRSAQICKTCTILGNLGTITQERKKEIRQMIPYFSSTFWALTVSYIHFLYLNIAKIHFHGVLLLSILVSKILELWRCKEWDQNFFSFDSGNIHIKESKDPGFIYFFFQFENQICLMSWSTFACSRMLFYIGLKLRLWNFKPIFLRMQFSLVAMFFLYFWLSVWV